MASIESTNTDSGLQEMALIPGSKRSNDSLFLNDDDENDAENGRNAKKSKQDHDSTYSSQHETALPNSPKAADDDFYPPIEVDEDGFVRAHDPFASGIRPRLAIYHPSFKRAEKIVSEICSDFIEVVKQVKEDGYDNPIIDNICESEKNSLKDWIQVQNTYPSVLPVACLGSAGIGKSSFTGCILGNRGAAPESDGTQRGTNVVHEYSAAMSDQTALYKVTAPYYRPIQVRGLVKTHCRNILKFVKQEDADMEEDEVDDFQSKHDTGIEFFLTLLCDQEGFESIEEIQTWFDEHKDCEEDEVVESLAAYVERFKETRNLEDGQENHWAESNGELAEIFRLVSKPPRNLGGRNQKPHPWPLFPRVVVAQDTELLNAGVVLADCPGIGDSNQSVVDATKTYLSSAGTILIFESIKRINTNQSLDANLRECIRLGKMASTILIVTMIDIKQGLKPEEIDELLPADRDRLLQAERRVATLQSKRKALKQAKADATGDEYKKLDKLYEEMPVRIAAAEARVDQINIEIRNREVAQELKGKFRKLERSPYSPDLPVFFISNTQYQKHLGGYSATQPPCLDLKGTGIPAVRDMLFEIPARGKKNTLRRISCTALPIKFNSVTGVLTKSPLARKADVEKVLRKVLSGSDELVDSLVKELRNLFGRYITNAFTDNEKKWTEKAGKLAGSWEKIKCQTFVAFCRHSGHWRLKKGEPNISWNNKIQGISGDKLESSFNALDEAIIRTETSTISGMCDLLAKLENELEECEDFQGNQEAKAFFKTVRLTRDKVIKDMSKLFEALKLSMAGIRHKAILEDEDQTWESYVSLAMNDTYYHCLVLGISANPKRAAAGPRQKGSKKNSVHSKRVDAIRQKLMGTDGEKSIFASVLELASESFDEIMEAWEKKCHKKIEHARECIFNDFGTRFVVPEVKTEENEEAVEKLKTAANNALNRIEGELKKHIDAFEAYEKSGGALK